jgi:hypothetical protein
MGKVPLKPPTIRTHGTQSRLRIANPIYGRSQWYEHAQAVNGLIGRGNTIATGSPIEDATTSYAIAPGSSKQLTHWISPHSQVKSYLWLITLKARGNGTAFGVIEDDSSTHLASWICGAGDQARGVTIRVQQSAGATPADGELTIHVHNDGASLDPVFVASHTVIELPRYRLTTAPDENTCETREPIFEADDNLAGVDGVTRLVPTARAVSRRAGMVSVWLPDPLQITSGSFVPCMQGFVRPRCLYGETTRTLSWRARVRATGGDGELFVQTGISGGATTDTSSTATVVSNLVFGYHSGSITARTEEVANLAAGGGWRDDLRELITLNVRKTTGTVVEVQGFWVWEPQP